jgi:predicted MFS family arabinose efflux permease
VLIVVMLVRLAPSTRAAASTGVWRSIAEGIRYVRSTPALRTNMQVLVFNVLTASAYIGMVPAVAHKVFHGGKNLTSVFSTALGVGAVLAAVALSRLVTRFSLRGVIIGVTVYLPLVTILYAIAPNPAVAFIAIAGLGFGHLTGMLSYSTVVQTRVPTEMRGRAISINTLGLGTAYPVAVALQGWLGDRVGLRAAMGGFAAVAVIGIVLTRAFRPGFTEALADEVPVAV